MRIVRKFVFVPDKTKPPFGTARGEKIAVDRVVVDPVIPPLKPPTLSRPETPPGPSPIQETLDHADEATEWIYDLTVEPFIKLYEKTPSWVVYSLIGLAAAIGGLCGLYLGGSETDFRIADTVISATLVYGLLGLIAGAAALPVGVLVLAGLYRLTLSLLYVAIMLGLIIAFFAALYWLFAM